MTLVVNRPTAIPIIKSQIMERPLPSRQRRMSADSPAPQLSTITPAGLPSRDSEANFVPERQTARQVWSARTRLDIGQSWNRKTGPGRGAGMGVGTALCPLLRRCAQDKPVEARGSRTPTPPRRFAAPCGRIPEGAGENVFIY
jgi:hypothetical protein